MILLDTNVVSALMMARPDEVVVRWLDRQPQTSVWTTSINVFESRSGLLIMPLGKRRSVMIDLYERVLRDVIQGRILHFDEAAAQYAAELTALRHERGRPVEDRDTMIAGIVLASRAKLATRNVRHFADIAGSVINPWEA